MADYGITQAHIDELIAHIGQLTAAFGSTRDAILKMNIDQLVTVLATDHHAFALSYQKAREVVDLHGKKHKPGDETPAA